MAGKTKVDLKFEMTNGTNQVVSFEVPNGKDGGAGLIGFSHWRPTVTAGQKVLGKSASEIVVSVSVNGVTQPSPVWVDKGTSLEFAEGLQAGDIVYCLVLKG